ncbi:MAG TPA: cytochrome c oxidase assembly protein [Acidimicrobiales bacterium]|nr:cytochrome c oxidase assembly protein [Acidimicrobiales bacterium]
MLAAVAARFPPWHAHYDVWALVAGIAFLYGSAVRREKARRPLEAVVSRFQLWCFYGGLGVMWLASDWPIHDLAEGYLYSAHMVQHLLFTLVVALLFLAGTPAWMARNVLGSGRRLSAVRAMSRPVTGLIQFNVILVASHWPVIVDLTLRHHPFHFVAHAILLTSALFMWMPIASPLPEIPRLKPPTQMLYLFMQTIVPTVPASFLTFNSRPLYKIYTTFPRLWHISALSDQQFAGLIMKILGGLYLWAAIAVVFFRWYADEERNGPDADVLHWHDVEHELVDGPPRDPEAEPLPPVRPGRTTG